MRRLVPSILSLLPVLLLAACVDTAQPTAPGDVRRETEEAAFVPVGPLGDAVPGLNATEEHLFGRGRYLFQKRFTPTKGLGPSYNERSCASCHGGDDGDFSGGTTNRVESHFTRLNADSSCSTLAIIGGVVHQDSATVSLRPYFTSEPFPSGQHQVAQRITPDLFGFGLIAAIPESAILALADPADANADGISGRANMVGGVAGRFGRKAAAASLDTFNAAALLNEMGITNPLFTSENLVGSYAIGGDSIPASVDLVPDSLELDSGDLASINAFIRFMAPPPSLAPDTMGERLFNSTGCTKCHTAQTFTTASSYSVLNGKSIRPFSDFLLHDMGAQVSPHLGDICLAHAGRTEFRTEPLMGARFMTAYMHDGLATSVDQAIQLHGGEGDGARTSYNALTSAERQAVRNYVLTL